MRAKISIMEKGRWEMENGKWRDEI